MRSFIRSRQTNLAVSLLVAGFLSLLSPLVTSHYSLVCGQSEFASVSGRVTDQQNAVVPDVEIELRNSDTVFRN